MNPGQTRRDALASSYRIAISNGKSQNHEINHVHDTLGTLDIINLVDNRCESDTLSVSTHPSWIGQPETPFNSVNSTKPKKSTTFSLISTRNFIYFLTWLAITVTLLLVTVALVGKYHRDHFDDQINILVTEIEKISIEKRQIENDLENMADEISKCENYRENIRKLGLGLGFRMTDSE